MNMSVLAYEWGTSCSAALISWGGVGGAKLSTAAKQKLRTGEDVETKKRTILALAAGVEWMSQGQPKRCPSRRRIDVLSSSIRLGEIIGAEQPREKTTGAGANVARGIQSICHDVLTSDREHVYQALWMFLLPTIWR